MFHENVLEDLSFYKLFLAAEKVRWSMSDIDWNGIEKDKVSPWLIRVVRDVAASEFTTYSATQQFLTKFGDDLDLSQWMSVWFYEETKHPFVLMKWLSMLGETFDTNYVLEGRKIHPMRDSKMEMLALNIISEIMASGTYHSVSKICAEPVLKTILKNLSGDEMRHATGFFIFAKQTIAASENPDLEKLRALQILFYSVSAKDQHHPVNEVLRRLEKDHGLKSVVASLAGDEAQIERRLLLQFSQLTEENLQSKQDVLAAIQAYRRKTGGA